MVTMAEIVTDAVLDSAYAWLCERRKDWPPIADVWTFRRRWAQEKPRLRNELLEGTYRVSLLSRVTLKDGQDILNLLGQYLTRSSERGGLFWDYERGISRGCPLSPLIGAFFLKQVDDRMERRGVVLRPVHGRHPGAQPHPLAVEESREGRQ